MTHLRRWFAVAVTCLILGSSSSAFAWLKVCNNTGQRLTVHFLFWDPTYCSNAGDFAGRGWYNIECNTCAYVNGLSQNGAWVYYHANSADNSLVWTSGSFRYWMPYAPHDHYCINNGPNGTSGLWLNHRELHITSENYTLNFR